MDVSITFIIIKTSELKMDKNVHRFAPRGVTEKGYLLYYQSSRQSQCFIEICCANLKTNNEQLYKIDSAGIILNIASLIYFIYHLFLSFYYPPPPPQGLHLKIHLKDLSKEKKIYDCRFLQN